MRTFLKWIGGLIAVLIAITIIAPMAIDWNDYKPQIESRASQAIGLPVSINGKIAPDLFPLPAVTVNNIIVAQPDGFGGGKPFATIERLSGSMALAPLFAGNLKISEIIINGAEINLIQSGGRQNWNALIQAGDQSKPYKNPPSTGGDRLAIDHVGITDSQLTYQGDSETEAQAIRDISADIGLQGLKGPYDIDLSADAMGQPLQLTGVIGKIGKTIPLDLAMQMPNSQLEMNGQYVDRGVRGQLNATYTKLPSRLSVDRVSVTGKLEANARQINYSEMKLGIGNQSVSGSINMDLTAKPMKINANLASDQFNTDTILATGEKSADKKDAKVAKINLANELASIHQTVMGMRDINIPTGLSGSLSFSVDQLNTNKQVIRDLGLTLNLLDGLLEMKRLSAQFPGTTLGADGKIGSGDAPAEINLTADISDARRLSDWLGQTMIRAFNPSRLSLPILIGKNVVKLDQARLIQGGQTHRLTIDLNPDRDPMVIADFDGQEFQLDSLDTKSQNTSGTSPSPSSRPSIDLSGVTAKLSAKLDRLDLAGLTPIGPISGDLDLNGSEVMVNKLSFSGIKGNGRAEVTGQINDIMGVSGINLTVNANHPEIGKLLGRPINTPVSLNTKITGSRNDLKFDGLTSMIVDGQITGTANYKPAKITADLTATDLNLTPLVNAATGSSKSTRSGVGADSTTWSRDHIDLSPMRAMNADISLSARNTRLRQLTADQLTINASLTDGKLVIDPVTGKFDNGGQFDLQVSADASADPFNKQVVGNLSHPAMDQLLGTLNLPPALTGSLTADLDLTASGQSQYELMQNLNGQINAQLTDPVIQGADLTTLRQRILDARTPQDVIIAARSSIGQGQTPLSDVTTGAKITDGIAKLDKTVMPFDNGRLIADGRVNLLNKTMDVQTSVDVSREDRLPTLGIRFTGAMNNPNRRLEVGQLQQFIADQVGKRLQDFLSDKLGQGQNDLSGSESEQQQIRPRDAIRGLLDQF